MAIPRCVRRMLPIAVSQASPAKPARKTLTALGPTPPHVCPRVFAENAQNQTTARATLPLATLTTESVFPVRTMMIALQTRRPVNLRGPAACAPPPTLTSAMAPPLLATPISESVDDVSLTATVQVPPRPVIPRASVSHARLAIILLAMVRTHRSATSWNPVAELVLGMKLGMKSV